MADRNIPVIGDGDTNGQVIAEDIINVMGAALTGAATLREILLLKMAVTGPTADVVIYYYSTYEPVVGGKWTPTVESDPLTKWSGANFEMEVPFTGEYLIHLPAKRVESPLNSDHKWSGPCLRIGSSSGTGVRYRLGILNGDYDATAMLGFGPCDVIVRLTAGEFVSFWTVYCASSPSAGNVAKTAKVYEPLTINWGTKLDGEVEDLANTQTFLSVHYLDMG